MPRREAPAPTLAQLAYAEMLERDQQNGINPFAVEPDEPVVLSPPPGLDVPAADWEQEAREQAAQAPLRALEPQPREDQAARPAKPTPRLNRWRREQSRSDEGTVA